MTERARPSFSFTQRVMLAVVPRVVWALLHVVGLTWRFRVVAEEGVTPAFHGFEPGREIYCFWHQCVLPCAYYFRATRATILISNSFDGELITRTLKLLGYDAVRGSSSRGGREGMLGLRRVLDAGRPVIFTADGPRGPIHRAKPGAIKLSQLTAAPVGTFHLQPDRCWTMRSWDRFLVPKPFATIVVSWGRWIAPVSDVGGVGERGGDGATRLEAARQDLDLALEAARLRAVGCCDGSRA